MSIKKFLKDFLFYGINGAIGKILALVTLPIITRIFSASDYGIIETINANIALLPLLFGLGYDMALKKMVLIDAGQDEKKIRDIVSTIFWFLLVWGGFITIIILFLSTPISFILFKSDENIQTVRLSFISIYIALLFGFELTLLRVYFKSAQYTILNTINTISTYTLIIIFVALIRLGISGYFYATMIAGAITFIITFWFVRKDIKLFFKFEILKSVLKFGIPVLTASLAYWIFNLSDRLILSSMSNTTETGLYSMGIRITSIVPFVVLAFREAWVPRAYQLFHSDEVGFPKLLNSVHHYSLLGFGILGMLNLVGAKILLHVLTTSSFFACYSLIAPLVFANVLFPLTFVGSIGIYLSNKTKYITLISWIAALLNVILNIIFVPIIGALSAAITTAISYFVLYIMNWYYTSKLMNWRIHFFKPLCTMGLIGLFCILTYIANNDNILIDFLEKTALFAVFIIVIFVTKLFSISEIKNIIERLRKK